MRRTLLALFALFALAWLLAGPVGTDAAPARIASPGALLGPSTGRVLHVAPSGSDRNPGTARQPLRTVARGLALARPGARVQLHSGRYPERVMAGPRGTRAAPITLEPAPGARPVIAAGFKLEGARFVRVTGLLFDGAGSGDWGTSIWSSGWVELSYNEIRNYRGGQNAQGVLIKSGTDVHLIGNRIHDNGAYRPYDHGIYCEWARRPVIANNVIYGHRAGYGVHLYGDCDDARVLHNTIASNWASGVLIGGGDERGRADRALVAGNVISDHGESSDAQSGYAVREYQPGAGNVVRDNLFFANAREEDADCEDCEQAGNVEGHPGYRAAGAGDYHLGPSSAALGRGPALGVRMDAEGRPRPPAGADLGAYERPSPRDRRGRP